ncbi:MAG: hypothetical protein H6721_25695 [Sandaracinus sp.]|nr:hypothetical protein [Sandaracinus sp.]MCB9614094.1 hypothetical protein [Sandaracinus sp.]MCB9617523.1 hypothetical protein [Sandaracinus sp.]MCB9625566.1 hypothetical protein [Sandaracinus sp.]MCB9635526.1 hypothetical protein [Sandaracinus sp.]
MAPPKDLGDPNAREASPKQWIAFGVALVVLVFAAVWIAASRQGDTRRVPRLAGRPLQGTFVAAETLDGCALDRTLAGTARFAVHPGRVPTVGPALHPCETTEECAARSATRSLGTTVAPIPLPLLGGACGECGESHADVSWDEALAFPVSLAGAEDPNATRWSAERNQVREPEGRCLRLRYTAELSREGEALVYERRVFFESAPGTCETQHVSPTTCVAARRWRLERE